MITPSSAVLDLLIIATIVIAVVLVIKCNETAICPITQKKDFKTNMFYHMFSSIDSSHKAWYSKLGYEQRFNCKIIACEKNSQGWKAVSKKTD